MSSTYSDDDSIQLQFNKAAEYVQMNVINFTSKDLLELYGLYKQSTCGPCSTPKPNIFNAQGRAKWDAWNNLGDLSKSKAMSMYVEKVQESQPNWNQDQSEDNVGNKKTQWVCTSTLAKEYEDEIAEMDKTPFDYIKENNLDRIQIMVSSCNVNKFKDAEGMRLIHWAVDRNAVDILKYLLSLGADANSKDNEDQTPLHYAATCGHTKCAQILLTFGADRTLCDRDGQSPMDVAFDDTMRNMISNFVLMYGNPLDNCP